MLTWITCADALCYNVSMQWMCKDDYSGEPNPFLSRFTVKVMYLLSTTTSWMFKNMLK